MPTLSASPLLLDSTLSPAEGSITAALSRQLTVPGGLATMAGGRGLIKAGVALNADSSGPFSLPHTPEGVGIELWIAIRSNVEGRFQQLVERRLVSVPDQTEITWADLVDLDPVLVMPIEDVPQSVAEYLAELVAAIPPGEKGDDGDIGPAGVVDSESLAAALEAEGPAKDLLSATFVPRWAPLTEYAIGAKVVSPSGDTVTAIAAFTSGEAYSAANWALSPTYAALDVDGDLAIGGAKIELGDAPLIAGEALTKSIIDPTLLPNGVLTKATAGIFHGVPEASGDNTVIVDGKLTFLTPLAGGSGAGTTHIHLETPNGEKIQYMRAVVEFPAECTTPVTFVFPAQSWLGVGLQAGVHTNFITRNGTVAAGIIQGGGYPSTAPVNVAQRNNTLGTPLPGRTVDIEHWFNKRTGRVVVHVDGKRELEYTDADAIPYVSKYGDLEISQAGSETAVAPFVHYFEISSEMPPIKERGTFRLSANVGSAVTVASTFTTVNSGAALNVTFPESGQVTVQALLHLTQDAGRTQLRVSDGVIQSDALSVAVGAYAGQVHYAGRLTGPPGKVASVALQAVHADGGTATVQPNGTHGPVVLWCTPNEPYVPSVEA